MNLHEIIAASLTVLRLGTEASSVDTYRREFTDYANDAVNRISRKFRQTRTETVELSEDSTFITADLSRPCYKICWVRNEQGHMLPWEQIGIGTGEFRVIPPFKIPASEKVVVTYEFRPARLVNGEDVPEVPEFSHDIIKWYVCGQHRMSAEGSVNSGNYYLQLFERELNELPNPSYGEPRAYKLKGYSERLI